MCTLHCAGCDTACNYDHWAPQLGSLTHCTVPMYVQRFLLSQKYGGLIMENKEY